MTSEQGEAESFWRRSFSFHSPSGVPVALTVSEAFGAGLGGTVWSGSVALARYLAAGGAAEAAAELHAVYGPACQLHSLELGCGCSGLPSLVVGKTGLFAAVTLTERDEDCILALSDNVAENLPGTSGCVLEVMCLDWNGCKQTQRVDLLLLADLAYGMEVVGEPRCDAAACALWTAIDTLSGDNTVVLLAQLLLPLQKEQCFEACAQERGWRRERLGVATEEDGLGVFRFRRSRRTRNTA
jgi:hypothetical protein